VTEHLASNPDVRDVGLFAQPINRIDATGVEVFGQLRRMLETRGITLHISGIKLPVQQVLERAGALEPSPRLKLYRTDAEALAALQGEPGLISTPARGAPLRDANESAATAAHTPPH
jgi:SulP family sulfate permease